MANTKKIPKYDVLSIRVTDKEKTLFDKLKRNTQKNISMLMREALQNNFPMQKWRQAKGNNAGYQLLDVHILPFVLLSGSRVLLLRAIRCVSKRY